MLRNDGKYIIYVIKHIYQDINAGEWANTGDGGQMFPGGNKITSGEMFKKAQNPFTACGECWQQTGTHGTYNKTEALEFLSVLAEAKNEHRFGVFAIKIEQKSELISEAKMSGPTMRREIMNKTYIIYTEEGQSAQKKAVGVIPDKQDADDWVKEKNKNSGQYHWFDEVPILIDDTNRIKTPNAEAHAPMNVPCSKCGKVYCDHENKY